MTICLLYDVGVEEQGCVAVLKVRSGGSSNVMDPWVVRPTDAAAEHPDHHDRRRDQPTRFAGTPAKLLSTTRGMAAAEIMTQQRWGNRSTLRPQERPRSHPRFALPSALLILRHGRSARPDCHRHRCVAQRDSGLGVLTRTCVSQAPASAASPPPHDWPRPDTASRSSRRTTLRADGARSSTTLATCVHTIRLPLCTACRPRSQRFDQGPSLLLLPELFRETFADFGTSLEQEGVRLVKCDPNYEVYFDDGEQFTMSSDLTVMKDQIERYEGPGGFERYLGFLQEAHRHYEVSAEHVLHKNFSSLPALLRPSFLRYIITLHPFENVVSSKGIYSTMQEV
jgi:hypothetical protein